MLKRVGRPVIFILVLIIAAMSYLAIFGISYYVGDNKQSVVKGVQDIRFGIDIRGGVDVTFKADKGQTVTKDKMNAAVQRLTQRLDSLNIKDRDLFADDANDRIVLRFPWKSDVKTKDPEAAIKELGSTSQLYFKGPDNSIILTGDDVNNASADVDQQDGGYLVSLNFKASGTQKFADATKKYLNKTISIYLDTTKIETATVETVIANGKATITVQNGGMTSDNAKALAAKINAGALPFKLVTDNYSTISPTLGQNALDVTVLAGIVAFLLICIFMILYYRLPGLIACVALCGHLAGTLLCISIPQITLTLPGIAGIILSIGMGVDANIITAERIKEELRVGKTLDGAIDAGFERSFSAIFDGNVTVVIVGILLCYFGSGAVQSFGYTLVIGVIFTLLMGVLFSRLMLKSLSKFSGVRKNFLFGGDKQ